MIYRQYSVRLYNNFKVMKIILLGSNYRYQTYECGINPKFVKQKWII